MRQSSCDKYVHCTRAFPGSLFCCQNFQTDLSSRRLSTSRSVARSSSWSSWGGSNTYFQNHYYPKHCQTILAWIDAWNNWICYDCLREGHSLDLAVRFNQWKIRKFTEFRCGKMRNVTRPDFQAKKLVGGGREKSHLCLRRWEKWENEKKALTQYSEVRKMRKWEKCTDQIFRGGNPGDQIWEFGGRCRQPK